MLAYNEFDNDFGGLMVIANGQAIEVHRGYSSAHEEYVAMAKETRTASGAAVTEGVSAEDVLVEQDTGAGVLAEQDAEIEF